SFVKSDQIERLRSTALSQQIFIGIELALSIQYRKKVGQARPIAVIRQRNCLFICAYRVFEPFATRLLVRIINESVFGLLERRQYRRAVVENGLSQARILDADVRANAASGENGDADSRARAEEIPHAER